MNIHLRIGDEDYTAVLQGAEQRPSLHTGRPLLTGSVDVWMPRQAIAEVSGGGTMRATVTLEEGDSRAVDLRLGSSSYQSGDEVGQCLMHVSEVENLNASSIEFEGIVLEPYGYSESAEKDETALVVEAWVEVDSDQFEAVRHLWATRDPQYFPVIRRGVEDRPREMRFGQPTWSRVNEQAYKLHLILVEKSYDDSKETFSGIGEPQAGNVQRELAWLLEYVDALVARLQARELLGDEDVTTARRLAEARRTVRRFDFHEEADVDQDMKGDGA